MLSLFFLFTHSFAPLKNKIKKIKCVLLLDTSDVSIFVLSINIKTACLDQFTLILCFNTTDILLLLLFLFLLLLLYVCMYC